MSALRKIQVMRRQVGLHDDEDWRDVLERCTGQRSARGLTVQQSTAVITELERLGAAKAPRPRKTLTGPYAAKLQALWITCWNLGLVDCRTDAALNSFAQRQTGLGHANWIRHEEHAVAVIEALKSMATRAGVQWGPLHPMPGNEWLERPEARVAMAQFKLLACHPEIQGQPFQGWVHGHTGSTPRHLNKHGWREVMNKLGQLVRQQKEKTHA
ncbi:MAG: regulatory protein GemA [Pseudomonadota bacterium]